MERDDAGPWKEHRRSTMSSGMKNKEWKLRTSIVDQLSARNENEVKQVLGKIAK